MNCTWAGRVERLTFGKEIVIRSEIAENWRTKSNTFLFYFFAHSFFFARTCFKGNPEKTKRNKKILAYLVAGRKSSFYLWTPDSCLMTGKARRSWKNWQFLHRSSYLRLHSVSCTLPYLVRESLSLLFVKTLASFWTSVAFACLLALARAQTP